MEPNFDIIDAGNGRIIKAWKRGVQLVRVYFNSRAEAPFVWSIDRGTTATEYKVREVHLVCCSGFTRVELGTDNKLNPRAWLELYAEVDIVQGFATITAAGDDDV